MCDLVHRSSRLPSFPNVKWSRIQGNRVSIPTRRDFWEDNDFEKEYLLYLIRRYRLLYLLNFVLGIYVQGCGQSESSTLPASAGKV